MVCDKIFPGEMMHTHLLTPNRKPMTGQSTDNTNVQLNEPISFIGVSYRSVDERLLTGAEITQ